MATLGKINFYLKVTKVHRKSVDKLIELADLERANNYRKLAQSMDENEEDFDVDAFHSIVEAPQIAFSLYALAIVHCYSIVENNRKLICLEIPGITDGQRKNLHDIRVVTQCLERLNIQHENIRCYKTMNEFRLVNNAVKHSRYSLSTFVTTESQKKYDSKALKSLYSNRAKHLETYLNDLYRRVIA